MSKLKRRENKKLTRLEELERDLRNLCIKHNVEIDHHAEFVSLVKDRQTMKLLGVICGDGEICDN